MPLLLARRYDVITLLIADVCHCIAEVSNKYFFFIIWTQFRISTTNVDSWNIYVMFG